MVHVHTVPHFSPLHLPPFSLLPELGLPLPLPPRKSPKKSASDGRTKHDDTKTARMAERRRSGGCTGLRIVCYAGLLLLDQISDDVDLATV